MNIQKLFGNNITLFIIKLPFNTYFNIFEVSVMLYKGLNSLS